MKKVKKNKIRAKSQKQKKSVYRVLADGTKPSKMSLRQAFPEMDSELKGANSISIPKTPENMKKLWKLGFPV
jgi:hypothetical protein